MLLRRLLCLLLLLPTGCATLRTTDTPRTATEQFLLSVAVRRSIDELSKQLLRDRRVWVDDLYLVGRADPSQEQSFLMGELRAQLLLGGVKLVQSRSDAEIILEVRAGGIGIDRQDKIFGIPGTTSLGDVGGVPVIIPEFAIVKWLDQRGYASVAYAAYWAETGELAAASGPAVGQTFRTDFWILGIGPQTKGDIPSAQD